MIQFKHAFLQVARDHKSVITFTHTTQRMLRHVQQMSNAHIFTMCWCAIDHNVILSLWHIQWRDVFILPLVMWEHRCSFGSQESGTNFWLYVQKVFMVLQKHYCFIFILEPRICTCMKLLENLERVCEQAKHLNFCVFCAMRVHTHTCHHDGARIWHRHPASTNDKDWIKKGPFGGL